MIGLKTLCIQNQIILSEPGDLKPLGMDTRPIRYSGKRLCPPFGKESAYVVHKMGRLVLSSAGRPLVFIAFFSRSIRSKGG